MTKHYTNKITLETFGYESCEEAKLLNDDFENLVLMTDSLFEELKNPPIGGKWTLEGWIIDDNLVKYYHKKELESELATLRNDLIFATAMGDDTSDIVKRIKDIRELLNEYD